MERGVLSVVLACDLGGTSFRAALVDERGRVRAAGTTAAPRPATGAQAEIDPTAWWDALERTTARLATDAPDAFAAVAGIAICGVTRTLVPVDRDGAPLRPAVTGSDARSDAVARQLQARFADHPEARHINAYHPLARLAWLCGVEPALAGRLGHVLEPKDYLNHRLTGVVATDPVSSARLLAAAADAPGGSLLARAGLPAGLVPPLRDPQGIVGPVRAGLPGPLARLAGVPVFCCSSDTWAAVAGLGALRPGAAYNISGTTEVLGLVGDRPVVAEGLMTVDWCGLWQVGGPGLNGADTLAWLLDLAGRGTDAVDNLLAGTRQPRPALFLPFLQGERTPYWDPGLRGAFLGLERRHGLTDLAYAVLEGVAFLNRVVLERAEAAYGAPAAEIRFGGGAAANPVWAQVKADMCGRPVAVGAADEPGVLGSAIVAWTGLGRFASLAEAQDRLVVTRCRHRPDPRRAAAYAALSELYGRAHAATAPLSRALSSFPGHDLPGTDHSRHEDTRR